MQVGISFVSIAKARASLDREAGGRGFDDLRAAAASTWERTLSRIEVVGGDETNRTLFYTLFMRLLSMPTDLGTDDEFGLWHSGVRQFTDFYCLWDSVRNANSLIGLFAPELEAAYLNCLLDIADHTGWLPDAWISGHSAMIQGGSSADILFCEAALKGLEGIDYAKALKQMRKNNEVQSPDPRYFGRYLDDYHKLGYLSTNVRGCVSRHLEYAYQDACIAALAAHLGQADVAATYRTSAQKVWNLWRQDKLAFCPRKPDGGWVEPFDPAFCVSPSWEDPHCYEGSCRQWSWNVQQDFPGLVARMGGPAAFIAKLDAFFDSGQYHSKETMLHVPWLYHYAGRPDLSAKRVKWALETYFKPTRDGLADNEDMGCQSAFYLWGSMGLYPIMGQDIYLIGTPRFERIEVALGEAGGTLVIETRGEGDCIAAAALNGRDLPRAWLRHGEIAGGGVLSLTRAGRPTDWGRETRPPSFDTLQAACKRKH